jgi:ParB-like chromosome segregation protein Spo0J
MPRRCPETAEWPIDRLKPHPSQARVFYDTPQAELAALKQDIEEHGLHHRVEILPDGTIVCGHRRVRVLKLLKRKTVPVRVLHDLAAKGEAAVRQRLITDNLLRRQLTPLGKVRCYVELMQNLTQSRHDSEAGELRDHLGEILQQSGRNVSRYLAVARLAMPIQEAFDRGELTLVQAARIATLRSEVQEQIATAIGGGVSAKEAVAATFPPADGRHRRATDALAAFVRAVRCGLDDLDGRTGRLRLEGDDAEVLRRGRALIDHLLRT